MTFNNDLQDTVFFPLSTKLILFQFYPKINTFAAVCELKKPVKEKNNVVILQGSKWTP